MHKNQENFVRGINGPYINSEELNYYMNGLRESYKESLYPAVGCIINLAVYGLLDIPFPVINHSLPQPIKLENEEGPLGN